MVMVMEPGLLPTIFAAALAVDAGGASGGGLSVACAEIALNNLEILLVRPAIRAT